MSDTKANRQTIAEFAIGVALCAGAYLMLVDPASRETAKLKTEIDQARAQTAEAGAVSSLTDEQVAELRRVASERSATIESRSALARDEAGMFATVMRLAQSHDVRIDQLQPGQSGTLNEQGKIIPPGTTAPPAAIPPTGAGPGTQAAAAPVEKPIADFRSSYTLFVTGGYSQIAALIASMQNELGYATIKSVRLTPLEDPGSRSVSATIETEHFAIDLSNVKPAPAAPASAAVNP